MSITKENRIAVVRWHRLEVCLFLVFAPALVLGGCQRATSGDSFRKAVYEGNITEVNRLLAENAVVVNDPDLATGMTPLEFAVIADHEAIAQILLAHGAKIDVSDKLGMNPVAHAVRKDNWPMVQLLIDNGARINDAQLLKENVTPLMIAAIRGHQSMAENLLAHGGDRTARDTNGLTAADHARLNGHKELAALLENFETKVSTTQKKTGRL